MTIPPPSASSSAESHHVVETFHLFRVLISVHKMPGQKENTLTRCVSMWVSYCERVWESFMQFVSVMLAWVTKSYQNLRRMVVVLWQSENNAKLNHTQLPRYTNDIKPVMKLRGEKGVLRKEKHRKKLRTDEMRKEHDLMRSLKYELDNNNNNHKNGPKQCTRACVTLCRAVKC